MSMEDENGCVGCGFGCLIALIVIIIVIIML